MITRPIEDLKKLSRLARLRNQNQKNLVYKEIEEYYLNQFQERAYRSFDGMGLTLLHWAVMCNQPEKVEELVDRYEMDVNICSRRFDNKCYIDYTPIYLAALHSDERIIKFLLDKNADISIAPKHTYYLPLEEVNPHESITAIAQKRTPAIAKLFELPSIDKYFENRLRDKREFKTTVNLFCCTFNFGKSRQQKLSAAVELKNLIENGNDNLDRLSILEKTNPAVAQGELGNIYKSVVTLRR